MRTYLAAFAVVVSLVSLREAAAVSIAYDDPVGGWTYAFLGNSASPGSGTVGNTFDALDGTWDRLNGSDSWDASALGGTFGPGNTPGGISALTEGATDFIRLQDIGDGRDHMFPDTANDAGSNRKIYLGHNIASDAGVVNPETIAQGVTLTFRARVATAATGVIDPQYPETAGGGENAAVAAGTAWPSGGSGLLGHDGGKGNFSLRQSTGDQVISFSLGLDTDLRSNGMPFGTTGLNMNSLNTTNTDRGQVDPYQSEHTLNVLPVSNLTAFHEFWITIAADTSGGGTHKVDVYVDGSEVANTFHVTAGNGNDYDLSYIAMGAGATPQQAAFDVDFFAYKEGIHLPGGPVVLGDTDGDGTGGEFPDDFVPIRDNFRMNANRSMGDLTGDSFVDFRDFEQWKTVFLGGGGSLADVDLGPLAGVPEPSAVALAIAGLLGCACVRRRQS